MQMSVWHLHTSSWSGSQRRRVTHMVPESVGPTPPGSNPADPVGEAIAALVDAVKAATGQDVRVFTSGNLSNDTTAFCHVTILPYVTPLTVAPVQPLAEATVDDAEPSEKRPCAGCP